MSVHKFREVQQRTLLSTKTGGCSENCSCCTQSSRYNTGSKAQKLMNKDAILFWPLLYLLTYMTFYDSLLTCTILSMFFVRDGALCGKENKTNDSLFRASFSYQYCSIFISLHIQLNNAIVCYSSTSAIGLNNNEYQISRGKGYLKYHP
jgi:hypothetical protein